MGTFKEKSLGDIVEEKNYVLVNKPYDGGPTVYGPYTFKEADALLKAGAALQGNYRPDNGYWSKLPSWWLNDSDVWMMRKLDHNFDPEEFIDPVEE